MGAAPGSLFTPEVTAAVMRHMNGDHGEDSLLICRALGGTPDATAAEMSGMDVDGIEFTATVPSGPIGVRVPWSETPVERAAIRNEVVRMYREACGLLGIEPREEG
ncbi:MAG: DUF2470 domain-containing protein [Tepidiformaceae bacterium]